MDGTEHAEPIPSLLRLVSAAQSQGLDVVVFGRTYSEGNGIHDTHMNQGSTGQNYLHRAGDDHNDHNDVWQDGALIVRVSDTQWAAYFAAFEQQAVPTDALGNPLPCAGPITR